MNFLKIAGSDIKGIFKNRFIRVSVIAIIVVPLLYSLLYLDAFWDPYGRLKDMPVAVVNLDKGTNVEGKHESYGQDFVDKLKDDDRVGWKFVSEQDANEGLDGNKYYAKLVITEDFSKDVASAKEGAPKQANLKFVCNEKKNFLAAQVNSKVESALREEITKTVTDTYVTGAFDNLYKVKDGMSQAADGSGQLKDGLQSANDGSTQLNNGQVELNNGISKLNGKVPELADGANKLNDGSNQLYNGQVALNDGISQLNGGLGTLNNGIIPLNEGLALLNNEVSEFGQVKDLNDGMCKLNAGLSKLNTETPLLVSGIGSLNGDLESLYTMYNNKVNNGLTDIDNSIKDMQNMLPKSEKITKNTEVTDKVKSAEKLLSDGKNNEALNVLKEISTSDSNKSEDKLNSDQLTELSKKINDLKLKVDNLQGELNDPDSKKSGFAMTLKKAYGTSAFLNKKVTGDKKDEKNPPLIDSVSDMYKGSNDLLAGTNKLNEKVPGLMTGVPQLYAGSNEAVSGIKKLYSGSNDALTGSKKLVSGQGDLKDGITTLNGKVPELKTGVTKLYDGSNKLVSGQQELKDGVTKLHDGSNELANKLKDGSNELNNGLVNTSQDMGTFVATPVNLEVAPINPVPNYGSGFSPYFINLSLWIGAIMMFFVISAKTEQYEGATRFDKAFGKFLSFGFVGILQAVLVGIVVLILGLSPGNIPLYFASLIFFSLVYVAVVQCLISLFGDAGRLLSIVLLILQLTGCAGTFPLELVPKFFVVINPLMPFTYSVDALREICSASVINYGVIGKDYFVLAIVMVIFLTISIVGANFGEKMQRVIEGRKQENN